MTTTINASTSAGLVQTADTSGVLQLQTANTAALTIDASQNVGVGTASPQGKFQINQGTQTYAQVILANSSTDNGTIRFVNAAYTSEQATIQALTGGNLAFTTGANAVERMRIDSSGNVGIGTVSPGAKFEVKGGATDNATININNNNGNIWKLWNDNGANGFNVQYNGTTQLLITSAGNLGFGTSQVAVNNVGAGNNLAVFTLSDTSTTLGASKAAVTVVNSNTTTNNQSQLDFATTNGSGNAYWNTSATIGCIFGARTASSNYYASGTLVFMTAAGGVAAGTLERMRINSGGIVFINTTTDNVGYLNIDHPGLTRYAISCNNTDTGTSSQIAIRFNRGASYTQVGTITTTNAATNYGSGSDYRLKENIKPMANALDVVEKLKPVTFNWKIDGSNSQGFIAHELQEIFPEAVSGEKDAVDENGNPQYQCVDSSFLVATLTAAIKEQQILIQSLTNRISQLEK